MKKERSSIELSLIESSFLLQRKMNWAIKELETIKWISKQTMKYLQKCSRKTDQLKRICPKKFLFSKLIWTTIADMFPSVWLN